MVHRPPTGVVVGLVGFWLMVLACIGVACVTKPQRPVEAKEPSPLRREGWTNLTRHASAHVLYDSVSGRRFLVIESGWEGGVAVTEIRKEGD